jgi:protein-disulfide isomerase
VAAASAAPRPEPRLMKAAAFVVLALALAGCDRVDKAFDNRVHAYLVSHPEVVQEALDKLQAKQQAQAAAVVSAAIDRDRQAIERDPRDFVANPNGKITLTEFYDYRCPHCAHAAPAVLQLIHDNPDVRVVFKEFPIFGAVSEKAAAGAIAVKKAGGDYLGLYNDFMSARPLDDAAIDRILAAHGVTAETFAQPDFKAAANAQLQAVRALAIDIGAQGTPTFLIGDTVVPGEDMDAVHAAINKARGKA